MVKDNKQLGTIKLTGIPPAKRGEPKIKITFEADANGILKIYAEEDVSKSVTSVEIKPAGGFSESEIEKMISEANENEHIDKEVKMKTEFKINAESEIKKLLTNEIELPTQLKDQLNSLLSLLSSDFEIKKAKEHYENIVRTMK